MFRLCFFLGGGTTRRAAQERAADEKFLQACAQYLISGPELQFLQSKQRYLDPTGPLGVPDSRSEDTGSAGRDGEGAVGGARRRVIKLTFSARGATSWSQERLPGPFCSKNTSDSRKCADPGRKRSPPRIRAAGGTRTMESGGWGWREGGRPPGLRPPRPASLKTHHPNCSPASPPPWSTRAPREGVPRSGRGDNTVQAPARPQGAHQTWCQVRG